MRLALAGLVLCCGCSLSTVNYVALTASTATLACDWGQTRGMAETGWGGGGFEENNPIMGTRPEASTVDLYFASAAALQLAIWRALPRKARWALPLAVIALQLRTVAVNAPHVAEMKDGGAAMRGYACGL